MLFESEQHRGQSRRLHADHFHFGPQFLDRASDAGNQSAAAHGNDHRLQLRALLEQLEADRALAGDYGDIVEGVHKREPLLGGEFQGMLTGFVVIDAVEDDISSVILCGRHLHHGRRRGHDDGAADFAKCSVIRDRLGVISRGGADHAALLFFRAEQKDFVERAAFLVCAGHLQIFELEIHLLSRGRGELGGIWARRIVNGIANAVGGFSDHGEQLECGGLVHLLACWDS